MHPSIEQDPILRARKPVEQTGRFLISGEKVFGTY
jgi:hypothetical protein